MSARRRIAFALTIDSVVVGFAALIVWVAFRGAEADALWMCLVALALSAAAHTAEALRQ